MFATKDTIRDLGRLKKRSDFLRAGDKGQRWVSASMVVQIIPNDGLGRRFGITATKRLSKRAVDRNRVKRRLRAAACEILPQAMPDHHDVVLVGRAAALDNSFDDLRGDLRWCLRRLATLGPDEGREKPVRLTKKGAKLKRKRERAAAAEAAALAEAQAVGEAAPAPENGA